MDDNYQTLKAEQSIEVSPRRKRAFSNADDSLLKEDELTTPKALVEDN
jgi:hypothetical protein